MTPGEEALSPSSFEPLAELPRDDAETGQLNFDEEPPTQVAIPSTQVQIPTSARVDLDTFDFDPDPPAPTDPPLPAKPARSAKPFVIGVAVIAATGIGAFGAHTIVEHLRVADAAPDNTVAAAANVDEPAAVENAEASVDDPPDQPVENPRAEPEPSAVAPDAVPTAPPEIADSAEPAAAVEPEHPAPVEAAPSVPDPPPEEPEVAVEVEEPDVAPAAAVPPPVPTVGPHAELLTKAQAAYADGKSAAAYKLAQESFDAKRTKSALLLMVRTGCSMGLAKQATADYRKLSLSSRKAIREECDQLGVDVGS